MATTVMANRGTTKLCWSPVTPYQDIDHLANRGVFRTTKLGCSFFSLPCAQVRADFGMHHWGKNSIYREPQLPPDEVMRDFIERHNAQQCGCFDPGEIISLDLLSMSGGGPNLYLPCQKGWADRAVVERFVATCYSEPGRLDDKLRNLILQRHDSHQCACQVPWSAGVVEMGKAPDPRLEPLAA